MAMERYSFGPYTLNAEAGTLLRGKVQLSLSYRGFRLLNAFLRRPGEVLTKSDLIEEAWQGIIVEEANLSVQIASLRKLLGPNPEGGDWITTIQRVGYRFAGPVDRSAGASGGAEAASKPSIAVLPFANLSDDRNQDYFCDGIVEDIIFGLSRLHWLLVIARNSTIAYKGGNLDVRQVALDLGVRYVLEGSVRTAGNMLRVTSQLIDTDTGAQLWADRYDRRSVDVFAMQDEITGNVVASIEPQLYAAENRRLTRRSPDSLDAWGFVMKAMPQIWTWSERDSELALADLRRAIEIEAGYARAHSLLAWSYITGAHMGWLSHQEAIGLALESGGRSIEHDADDPWGHLTLGYVHMLSRRREEAFAELDEALWLNPNFALGHTILGAANGFDGDGDEGLKHLMTAYRLSPRDPHQALHLSASALYHFVAGRYEESATLNRRAVQLRPRFTSAWRTLAAAAAVRGDMATAAVALTEAKRLQPELSLMWIDLYHPMMRGENRAIYIEGMRKAGLS